MTHYIPCMLLEQSTSCKSSVQTILQLSFWKTIYFTIILEHFSVNLRRDSNYKDICVEPKLSL